MMLSTLLLIALQASTTLAADAAPSTASTASISPAVTATVVDPGNTANEASSDAQSSLPVLSLSEALRVAEKNQPSLRQAQAQTDIAKARANEARAPMLPQLVGQASYQRQTANQAGKPANMVGTTSTNTNGTQTVTTFDTFNNFNAALTASQVIYDFGQSTQKWRASKATAQSQADSQRAQYLNTVLDVRSAFFTARAQKALVLVAKETLANQERHLRQIQGFVDVGTRPQIDLAQARTDRANAQLQLIQAENNYATSKAQLNLAMGIERDTAYEVGDDSLPPVTGEDQPVEKLYDEALRSRPELAALQSQLQAQDFTIKSIKGAYWPTLGVNAGATYVGWDLGKLAWNFYGQVKLDWPIFEGMLTTAQLREARANLVGIQAQNDGERQQILLEIQQAQLAVRAAKAGLVAAQEALVNANERLRLAEGRYAAGAGSVIELGDAQLSQTTAAAQQVRAEYDVSSARAQLLKALGRWGNG